MITYIFGAWLCRTSNPYLKKIRDTCGDNLYENITVIGGSDATQPRFRRMLPYVVTRNTVNNILFFKLSMAHHKLLWNGFCVLPSRDCFLAIYCSLTADSNNQQWLETKLALTDIYASVLCHVSGTRWYDFYVNYT